MNFTIYLNHMLDAIDKIKQYINGIRYNQFIMNSMISDAVIRQLEIIGEAGKRIPENIKEKYKNIPWKDIVGMRNKLIHDYFGVDLDAVW